MASETVTLAACLVGLHSDFGDLLCNIVLKHDQPEEWRAERLARISDCCDRLNALARDGIDAQMSDALDRKPKAWTVEMLSLADEARTTAPLLADPQWAALLTSAELGRARHVEGALLEKKQDAERVYRVAAPDSPRGVSTVGALRIGPLKYQVGDEPPITLAEGEDHVLCSLIDLGGGASKDELARQTGKDDAPRVLKAIRGKHPSLAPHILLPGGKGRGGYRTTIQHLR